MVSKETKFDLTTTNPRKRLVYIFHRFRTKEDIKQSPKRPKTLFAGQNQINCYL